MSKYIDLAEKVEEDNDASNMSPSSLIKTWIRATLHWLDRNPDQVPGRTITASEFERVVESCETEDYTVPPHTFAARLGITVVPDPEPTPRQRLEALIFKEWGDADDAQHITDAIVAEFDVSEKAPGGDDE